MIKEAGGVLALLVGGLYAFGGFDAYPRTVDGSPQDVMAELADLDIREMPGEPGSTAEAAGGVTPRIQLRRAPGRLEWVVLSGSQVATTMIARFEPVDGGARTRIVAEVLRGDAPEAFTSPAFRSEGVTLGLFQGALDAEIDEMVSPGWGPECDAISEELLARSQAAPIAEGNPFGAIARVGGMHAELVARGCNPDKAPGAGEFRPVSDSMNGGGGFEDSPARDDHGPQYGDPGYE
jgi:hypothetical protein